MTVAAVGVATWFTLHPSSGALPAVVVGLLSGVLAAVAGLGGGAIAALFTLRRLRTDRHG